METYFYVDKPSVTATDKSKLEKLGIATKDVKKPDEMTLMEYSLNGNKIIGRTTDAKVTKSYLESLGFSNVKILNGHVEANSIISKKPSDWQNNLP